MSARLDKDREVLTPQGQVAASKKAAASVRAKIAKEGNGNCQYGTTVPARGAWNPKDTQGQGVWTSPEGHVVPYKDGYPQFDEAYRMENGVRVNAAHPDGKVEIPDMKGTNADFTAAEKAMREKLKNPQWEKPKNYTWHHGEDGTSMTLVRSEIHHGTEGANHTGGAAIARNPEF